jgi:hypothetical protein
VGNTSDTFKVAILEDVSMKRKKLFVLSAIVHFVKEVNENFSQIL